MSGRPHPTTAWTAQLNGPDPDAARAEASGAVLEGFRIAVTSDRRSADLVDAAKPAYKLYWCPYIISAWNASSGKLQRPVSWPAGITICLRPVLFGPPSASKR